MQSSTSSEELLAGLFTLLADTHRIIAPLQGEDGAVRLGAVSDSASIVPGAQTLLPLKKYLLPCHDTVWRNEPGIFPVPPGDLPLAVLAIPPCEAHALTLLDLTFHDDPDYRRRRAGLLVVAAHCTPQQDCHCLVPDNFSCDLLLSGHRLWARSRPGAKLLQQFHSGDEMTTSAPPDDLLPPRIRLPQNLRAPFTALEEDPLWDEPAATCLACGACSAVCPTCACYDLRDQALPGAAPRRERQWDNCLFSNFAQVAGGHDFRPGLGPRLKFRMRHKLLGFGDQQGTLSCVGCGRCARHCPVGIGPQPLLNRLQQRGALS